LAEAKAAGWTVIVKEALANGRLTVPGSESAMLGDRPDATALAAALTQPWADVVLSGAATVPQLRSNLAALDEGEQLDGDLLATLAVDPQIYWRQRSAMRWT
jgi:aryl-alcohol dehydrogenase-like predicted oxidoreductase